MSPKPLESFLAARSLGARLDAFVRLVRWTREGGEGFERLTSLVATIEGSSEIGERFRAAAHPIFEEAEGVSLFADVGIPSDRGLLAEIGDRLFERVLPRPRGDRDLAKLVRRLFPTPEEGARLRTMPPETFRRMYALLAPGGWALPEPLRDDFADAFRLLAVRAAGQGLSSRVHALVPADRVSASPFWRLPAAAEALAQAWFERRDARAAMDAWRSVRTETRSAVAELHRRMDAEGVATDVVHALDVIERCLTRMEAMADVMAATDVETRIAAMQRLLSRLVVFTRQDRSIRWLLRSRTELLHRKIVERSGETGEHYVALDRAEYLATWGKAAGGGLLTTFTAALKMAVSAFHAAPFVHGFLYGLNYAVSFLLLQRWHLVLATKQPAMTAAKLAAIVRTSEGAARDEEIGAYAARIVRSQLAAAIANVVVVAAGAYAFDRIFRLAFDRSYLSSETALHVYEALSPLDSGTVFYAAVTGVILYAASVVGGWLDNWSAYHKIPRAIAEHPAGETFGRERLERLAESVKHGIGGFGTNVSLGFMLGMTPALGEFLGIPLDVRHVTLSTGQLALATAALDVKWFAEGRFVYGALGIGTMFVLNLSVSFLLSLFTAARAYGMGTRETGRMLLKILARFVRKPGEFLFP
ncbi:MAG TPA: hypothetical protein VF139_11120 [Candidatus Polarisedimenticolaceae bacterium]